MQKKIVSTCSPNNNMYWVCIQCIVKKFPDGLLLVTPYIWRIVEDQSDILVVYGKRYISIYCNQSVTFHFVIFAWFVFVVARLNLNEIKHDFDPRS